MALSDAQKQAQARYEKSGAIKRRSIMLHTVYDADIMKKLSSVENVNAYIKKLIREDIKRQG